MSFSIVAEPMDEVKSRLGELFDKAVIDTNEFRGELTLVVKAENIVEMCTALRDHPDMRYNMIADLTAVDYSADKGYTSDQPRFNVVYNLFSTVTKHRIRLRSAPVDIGTNLPEIDSVTGVWCGANWHERECYDMFGIIFKGHPDLRRILMPFDWEGHPLRKDFPVRDQEPYQYINKQLADE